MPCIFINPYIYDISIGSGDINRPEYPMYFYYKYGYFAFIYLKSEINVSTSINITGIRFEMDATDSPQTADNQTLKLAQVSGNEFDENIQNNMIQDPPAGWGINNQTIVKSNFTWSIDSNTRKYYTILFDTPFTYNPNDSTYPNLIVIWENRANSYEFGASSPWSECFTDGTDRSYYDYQDSGMPSPTRKGQRASNGVPNIKLIVN